MGGWLITLSSLAIAFANYQIPNCKKVFQNPVATFDLSALYKPDGSYTADDQYRFSSDLSRPFTYFFNVCGDVSELTENKLCVNDDGDNTAAAYQHVNGTIINEKKEECWQLGKAEEPKWSYIAGDNAGVGVSLTYEDGAPCRDSPTKKRNFTIEFSCMHEASAKPPVSAVYENQFCEYKVTFGTIWACPLECHTSDHSSVCGGHGICAVDTGTHKSRCFCNRGKGGVDCTQDVDDSPPSAHKTTTILAVVVLILLSALFAVAYILYVRIKKLNADDNPYGQFNDQVPLSASDQ